MQSLPEIVLVDGAHSPHLGHLCSNADELETDVRTRLDGQSLVISELRRCGVGIVDACLGDGLVRQCQFLLAHHATSSNLAVYLRGWT